MLVTCTGAHAEAAPLARTETGARAVCCQPARGEQTVLVARTGRHLPCARASEQACVCAAVRGRHEKSNAQTSTRTPESSQVHAFPGSRAAALRAEEQATVFSYRFGTRRSTALRQATSVKILAWGQGPAKVALASSIGSGTNSVVSGNSSHSVPASSTARLSTAIGSLRAGDVQAMRHLSDASRTSSRS